MVDLPARPRPHRRSAKRHLHAYNVPFITSAQTMDAQLCLDRAITYNIPTSRSIGLEVNKIT